MTDVMGAPPDAVEREWEETEATPNGADQPGNDQSGNDSSYEPAKGLKSLSIGSDVEIAKRVAKDLAKQYGEIVFDDGDFYLLRRQALGRAKTRRAAQGGLRL
jgi:hypothetical protein